MNVLKGVAKKLAALTEKPAEFPTPYAAGYDAGLNGSDTTNTDFRWFGSAESAAEWSRGNRDGEAAKGGPVH